MIKYQWYVSGILGAERGVDALLSQLSAQSGHTVARHVNLSRATHNHRFHLLLACDTEHHEPKFVGMASIFFQQNLARTIAEIHDVVVDPLYRGQGIGKELSTQLILFARYFARDNNEEVSLSLTSRPRRKEANAMYKKLGFQLVARAVGKDGTNLYKMNISPNA